MDILKQKSVQQTIPTFENHNYGKASQSVFSKPSYSKITLTKENEILKIFIPPKGFSPNFLTYIGFAICWNAFLDYGHLAVINTWSLESFFMALIALSCLGVCIGLTTQNVFNLFGKIWLSIDKKEISLSYQLLDFKYDYPKPTPREQISKLEIIKKVYFYKDSKGELIEVKPQINISAGAKKFILGNTLLGLIGANSIRQAEIEWLAYELSEWLDMPVSYI